MDRYKQRLIDRLNRERLEAAQQQPQANLFAEGGPDNVNPSELRAKQIDMMYHGAPASILDTTVNNAPTMEQILQLAWQSENPNNRGLNADGTYSPYPDPKGSGLMDVGPGILVGTTIPDKKSYTRQELDDVAYQYGVDSLKKIEAAYNAYYGDGAFDKVPAANRLIMLDTRYRTGSLPQSGYPNLYEAVYNNDVPKALIESRTSFTRNGVRIPDNDRVRRLSEQLFPGMYDVDSNGVYINVTPRKMRCGGNVARRFDEGGNAKMNNYINNVLMPWIVNGGDIWADTPRNAQVRQYLYQNGASAVLQDIYDNYTDEERRKTIDSRFVPTEVKSRDFKQGVTNAISEAGSEYVGPGLATVGMLPGMISAAALSPLSLGLGLVGGSAGGAASDAIARSQGYESHADKFAQRHPGSNVFMQNISNPGALIGGFAGGVLGGIADAYVGTMGDSVLGNARTIDSGAIYEQNAIRRAAVEQARAADRQRVLDSIVDPYIGNRYNTERYSNSEDYRLAREIFADVLYGNNQDAAIDGTQIRMSQSQYNSIPINQRMILNDIIRSNGFDIVTDNEYFTPTGFNLGEISENANLYRGNPEYRIGSQRASQNASSNQSNIVVNRRNEATVDSMRETLNRMRGGRADSRRFSPVEENAQPQRPSAATATRSESATNPRINTVSRSASPQTYTYEQMMDPDFDLFSLRVGDKYTTKFGTTKEIASEKELNKLFFNFVKHHPDRVPSGYRNNIPELNLNNVNLGAIDVYGPDFRFDPMSNSVQISDRGYYNYSYGDRRNLIKVLERNGYKLRRENGAWLYDGYPSVYDRLYDAAMYEDKPKFPFYGTATDENGNRIFVNSSSNYDFNGNPFVDDTYGLSFVDKNGKKVILKQDAYLPDFNTAKSLGYSAQEYYDRQSDMRGIHPSMHSRLDKKSALELMLKTRTKGISKDDGTIHESSAGSFSTDSFPFILKGMPEISRRRAAAGKSPGYLKTTNSYATLNPYGRVNYGTVDSPVFEPHGQMFMSDQVWTPEEIATFQSKESAVDKINSILNDVYTYYQGLHDKEPSVYPDLGYVPGITQPGDDFGVFTNGNGWARVHESNYLGNQNYNFRVPMLDFYFANGGLIPSIKHIK